MKTFPSKGDWVTTGAPLSLFKISISLKPTAPIQVPQAFEKASLPAQRPAK